MRRNAIASALLGLFSIQAFGALLLCVLPCCRMAAQPTSAHPTAIHEHCARMHHEMAAAAEPLDAVTGCPLCVSAERAQRTFLISRIDIPQVAIAPIGAVTTTSFVSVGATFGDSPESLHSPPATSISVLRI